MNILRALMAKPWEHAGEMEGVHGGNVVGRPAGKIGLYIFLAVITSLFMLFSISHHMRAALPDWKAVAEPAILWVNSVILVLASVGLQLAKNAGRKRAVASMRKYLVAGAVLTLMFFAGQWMAWREMLQAGFYASSNPANAYFYMFTAVHGLHLVGGMWFLAGAVKTALLAPEDDALPVRIALCATYWHYLLLVWGLLFFLLLTS